MFDRPTRRGPRNTGCDSTAAILGIWLISILPARGFAVNPDEAVSLPAGVEAVWDLDKAHHETTITRQRFCINGLWRWQPAESSVQAVPSRHWGYFKVPGCWPGITDYMQQDFQTLYPHPSWSSTKLATVTAAWYQRQIHIDPTWNSGQVLVAADCLNSYAAVFVDGERAGEMRFPTGEVDITAFCQPGGTHTLNLYVAAMPLKSVMLSFRDTASVQEALGTVARRGLCGDVWLIRRPSGAHLTNTHVAPSVRNSSITLTAELEELQPNTEYSLRADISDRGEPVAAFTSNPFQASDLSGGRISFTEKWEPDKRWDLHTPENQFTISFVLLDSRGNTLDVSHSESFGFREFWISGRDFYLNGTRIFLSALPLDNAQVGAALASYEGAKESLLRLKEIGINFVYTHNYGCEPGTHLSFAEILKAADDVGMLVALSQPHFGQYDWQSADAEQTNGYARHAKEYVHVAGNHPSVVMYAMSHNATGYAEDMNPEMIDGKTAHRDSWARRNVERAVRAAAIVEQLDPHRIVYHHSSGNLGPMHTTNFYTNFAPIQELSDWFEHWSNNGVKPLFTCEYMVPCTWDWTMYRGWYKGRREFGSATVPWEFCQAEWSAQFLGDRAYRISDAEKANLRWEAQQFRAGRLWHRWDYPYQVGNKVFEDQHEVIAAYLTDNWRAFRTWGVSAISPWEHHFYWTLRPGVDRSRKELPVDWEQLQRPGLSPDFLDHRYERVDLAYERDDWIATADGQAILRNNRPLLAYIAGKPSAFTSKEHLFYPGEAFEKQLIVINNSRAPITCDCQWTLTTDSAVVGNERVSVETGQQARIPLRFVLPDSQSPGQLKLEATFQFSNGETQYDHFTIDVLPLPEVDGRPSVRIALFDPHGETTQLMTAMGVSYQVVSAETDLTDFDVLIVGKQALTVSGAAPNIQRVRDGLFVLVFEQEPDVLQKRLGFRIAEYGLRQVFPRIPDHPVLDGLTVEHLRDWRGDSTLLPPRLKYELSPQYNNSPTVKWSGLAVPRVWRCGNRGNVASALIEKPARGDFLPIIDGGYSLQYSPLLEYREGSGTILFCQTDATGRTENDPAAARLVNNLLTYATDTSLQNLQRARQATYVGDEIGRRHLESIGIRLHTAMTEDSPTDQVLILGPDADEQWADRTARISDFLQQGGRIVCLGLDEDAANHLLPFSVRMKTDEHIAAYFEPFPAGSPFVGIGAADLHNRDPRNLPLLLDGATVFGNGVLATANNHQVVFCQFLPFAIADDNRVTTDERGMLMFGDQYSLKRTYRRSSYLLTRLLANLGVRGATPLLDHFGSPADVRPEPLDTTSHGRWSNGLYLDQPVEWDDPYRFFRW